MTSGEIRVQIPAGSMYEPALVEGAVKVAIRRGFTDDDVHTVAASVRAAAGSLNSLRPVSLELTMRIDDDALRCNLRAVDPAEVLTPGAIHDLDQTMRALGVAATADAAGRIGFEITQHEPN